MKKYRKKKKEQKEIIKDPRDKWSEMIVYIVLVIIALLGIITGYMMSKQFGEHKPDEDGHFIEIEKEK